MKKRFTMRIGLLMASFFVFQAAWATENISSKSIFDMMNYQEVLNITLEGNFETIKTSRRNQEKHKAVLRFKDENKTKQNWNIKLKLRGHFRRINCEMPPLKLDFKKSDLEAAKLARFDDLKLVTHCSANKIEAEEWLHREYLAYQMYRELTPNSYRVQMLRITYVDTETGKKDRNWGFIIEDTAQLTSRMKAEKIEQWGLKADDFHTLDFKVMSLFQYMIGNTDWEVNTSRNLKMFKKDGKVIAVPYDFDFSGLVATSYARPTASYHLTTIKERVYMGFLKDLHDMHDTQAIFSYQEKDIMNVIQHSRHLSNESKKELKTYLKDFFASIDKIQVREFIPPKEVIIANAGSK